MAMNLGRKRKLLGELDKLTHSGRVRYMSELGRDQTGTSELRTLLDSLSGDLHEWQLRLYAARAAGESSDIIQALSNPLRSVRSLAIVSLRTVDVDFAVLTQTIADMSASDRRTLLSTVRQQGDAAVADELIATIHERFGAQEASLILAACSGSVAAEWLPRLAHAIASWPSFVRSHPGTFIEFLRAQMSMAPIVRDAWWVRAAPGIAELVEVDPSAAIDLWADFGPDRTIPGPILQNLARLATQDINRTLTTLLEPGHSVQLPRLVRVLRRRIAHADDQILAQVAQAVVHHQESLATVLGAVAPSLRSDLFAQATADIDTSQLSWVPAVLQALPHSVRHNEARRMLELPAHRDSDRKRHELIMWLPIEDTWDELQAATTVNDPLLRAAAYRRFVSAVLTSHSADHFDRLLTELQRLRNEQDPVRTQALLALSECPVHLVTLDNMSLIDDLVGFAVEARDTSRQTTGALTALLQRLLASSATAESMPLLERCVDTLAKLAGHSGQLQLGTLYKNLPKQGEFVLYRALEPRLHADLRAGRPELLFNLVQALGPRGHGVPQLEAHLAELTRAKRDMHARRAIQLWLDFPGSRGVKIGLLIGHEPSTVLLHPVFRLVSLARQDLLDDALSNRALSGRFAPSRARQIPMIDGGFFRWNPSQRRTYASLLHAAANNEHTGHMRMGSIRTLARIPEVGTELTRSFVQSDDVVTKEAALSGLSWSETAGDELATLLSFANGDRARVAIYSATRAARFSRPQDLDHAIGALLEADDSKLTSRKEALRILGQNRTPGAIDVFTTLWSQRPLHRSISIALASALRNYPQSELTWEVHRELAAGDGDTALAVAQSMNPLSWPEESRSQPGCLMCSPSSARRCCSSRCRLGRSVSAAAMERRD